jgi:hypothetical protein
MYDLFLACTHPSTYLKDNSDDDIHSILSSALHGNVMRRQYAIYAFFIPLDSLFQPQDIEGGRNRPPHRLHHIALRLSWVQTSASY